MACSVYVTLSLFAPPSAHTQTVSADRYRLATGPCFLRSGSGTPEGVVTGNPCDMFIATNTGVWYTKWTGTGNTGWGVGHNANATINGHLDTTGYVSVPGYVSQLTGYRITAAGAGDFRYLFADELHAKSFIADLEQALAGGQIICKSVTSLGSNFTNPAPGGTATLTVRDLPSAENVATFQAGDYVGVRTFSRTAGALTIGESFGVVTSYADQAGGVQTWNFTRGTGVNGGGMATSTVVATDAIVIDYGLSGNGCHEVNALDGANSVNSPYAQTWTWTTSPIAANRTLRTRLGNLTGITAVPNEYGSVLGTYGTGAAQYVRASNTTVEMHNVNLSMYSGATEVFKLDRIAPSFAIGSAVPSAYGTGTGIWMGNDGGTYKFRAGTPGGAGLFWDGTSLIVRGVGGSSTNVVRNSECRVGTEDFTTFTNTGLTVALSFNLPTWRLHEESNTCFITIATGTPAAGTVSDAHLSGQWFPVVEGSRYEASVMLGLQRAATAHVYITWINTSNTGISELHGNTCTTASPGGTYLAALCQSAVIGLAPPGAVNAQVSYRMTHNGTDTTPYMFWVRSFFGQATSTQTEASAWGPAGLTEITGGMIRTGTIVAGHIAANTITAGQIAAGTITATEIAANTITAAKIAAATITATEIATDAITASKIAANAVTASKINVSSLSAITANIGNVTAGTISGVTITGVTINGTNTLSGTAISGGTINIGGNFIVSGTGSADIDNLDVHSQLALTNLTGAGSAYACISNSGVVYRSTAC